MVVEKNLLFFEEDIWKKLFSNDIYAISQKIPSICMYDFRAKKCPNREFLNSFYINVYISGF